MRTHTHEPNSNSPTHTRKQMQTPEWVHITPARTHITQHHHARADVCVYFKTAYSPLEAASPCVISVDTAMRVRQPKRTLGAAAQEDCPALVFPGACNPSSNLRRARCPFRHQGSTSNSDAKNTNTPQHPNLTAAARAPAAPCAGPSCMHTWSQRVGSSSSMRNASRMPMRTGACQFFCRLNSSSRVVGLSDIF